MKFYDTVYCFLWKVFWTLVVHLQIEFDLPDVVKKQQHKKKMMKEWIETLVKRAINKSKKQVYLALHEVRRFHNNSWSSNDALQIDGTYWSTCKCHFYSISCIQLATVFQRLNILSLIEKSVPHYACALS